MAKTLSESVSHAFGSLRSRMERFRSQESDPQRLTRIRGIRARLGLAMALSLLPFLLLGLAQVRGEYQSQTESLKTDLQLAALRSANHAAGVLSRTDAMLYALSPESIGPYCSTRLEILAGRMSDVTAFYRVDADGRPLCASDADMADALGPVTGSGWFEKLKSSDTSASSYLVHRPESRHVIQAERIMVPVDESGAETFVGAMIAIIPLAALEAGASAEGLDSAAQLALFDIHGVPLTGADRSAFVPQTRGLTAWVSDAAQRTHTMAARGTDGVQRFYASAPVRDVGIVAVISSPTSSPWYWALSNPIRFLMMPLAACLTAFAAVMFASERIVIRWLDYLDRIAAIYARGRYTVRPIQADNAPLEIRHLAQTLDELGDNITRRDTALTEALNEKDALLREIHHRVKNNLQIISSLLSMQQRAVSDPAARSALGDTRQRISALALIYRTLYQGTDVRYADSYTFLTDLVGHIVSSESLRGPLVSSSVEADSLRIDPEKLAPMALWLVEAISNAQKHAFAGRGGELKVRFRVEGDTSTLEVEDDGPGMNKAQAGVGLTLMTAFAKQLRGTVTNTSTEHGTTATLVFETPRADDHQPTPEP